MKKIPLSFYVACNAPDTAQRILKMWEVNMPSDATAMELANALSALQRAYGNGPVWDMLNLHPDKAAILETDQENRRALGSASHENVVSNACGGSFSNACGCSGFSGFSGPSECGCNRTSSCDGGCKCGGKCKSSSGFAGESVEKFTVFEHPFDGKKAKADIYPVFLFGIVITGLIVTLCSSK